jgi:hypothetical protein
MMMQTGGSTNRRRSFPPTEDRLIRLRLLLATMIDLQTFMAVECEV